MSSRRAFVAGGTVQAGEGIYVERPGDAELLRCCTENKFAYVLTSRQMGKSSLMVHTAEQLRSTAWRVIILDLTEFGTTANVDVWFRSLALSMADQLGTPSAISVWDRLGELTPPYRFARFVADVVVAGSEAGTVIFVDEIDTTLRLPFADDFFATIRHLYNARPTVKAFCRLSVVLIGAARPTELIQDPQRTPFNIGTEVSLADFTPREVCHLAQGLQVDAGIASGVIDRIFYWTAGHPYLTVRVLQYLQHNTNAYSPEIVDRGYCSEYSVPGCQSRQ
jgi:hypothetical protein